jgi:23S rRNA pseudouridine2605 synthase
MTKSKKEPEPGSDEKLPGVVADKPKAKARKAVAKAEPETIAVEAVAEKPAKKVVAKKAAVKKAPAKKAVASEPASASEPVADEPETEKPVAVKAASKKAAAKKAAKSEPVAVFDETEEAVVEDEPVAKAAQKKTAKKKAAAAEEEIEAEPAPKMERLQKILARAGISSRRKAEELITGGHVQINGKVVTELGSKADPQKDHVRVDGKLLQGPERIRYFMLNKPKGYVTTVSDPEGRPTVMQFFERENERLYPVGRLDYLSEGLLLVTNDGDLANKLTKASSGVEKTYLVKVAGQPTEDMLDALRAGVVIERGRPGTNSGRVRTAPAKIRQVRQGDNPWYEVILIEGRNRELRKMFEEIGHHVEKIRRIGYGPLILDMEPGKLRELDADEVQLLRLTADGKLKPKRRRGPAVAQLPREAGKTVRFKKADGKPGYEKTRSAKPTFEKPGFEKPKFEKPAFDKPWADGPRSDGPRQGTPRFDGPRSDAPRFNKPAGDRPAFQKSGFQKPSFDRPARASAGYQKPAFGNAGFKGKPRPSRPSRESEPPVTDYVVPRRPEPAFDENDTGSSGGFNPDYKPGFRTGGKPGFAAGGPSKRFSGSSSGPRSDSRPPFKAGGARGGFADKTGSDKPYEKPYAKPFRQESPAPEGDASDSEPRKGIRISVQPVEDRPRGGRSDGPSGGGKSFGKPFQPRTGGFAGGGKPFRSNSDRPSNDRPGSDRSSGGRPSPGRPGAGASGDRPFRSREDGPRQDRPFAGGKPFRPRTDGPPSAGRPFRPRTDGPPAEGRTFRPKPFQPRTDSPPSGGRPAFGRSSGPRVGSSRPGSTDRPQRFAPRGDAPPERRAKSFDGGDAAGAPREFRRRESRESAGREARTPGKFSGPKKFGGAKRFGATSYGTKNFEKPKPQPGGSNSKPSGKLGPDGQPRVKVRARDSFVGKNKGRPKPKAKKDE